MAWGYWSASAVVGGGRSPRRGAQAGGGRAPHSPPLPAEPESEGEREQQVELQLHQVPASALFAEPYRGSSRRGSLELRSRSPGARPLDACSGSLSAGSTLTRGTSLGGGALGGSLDEYLVPAAAAALCPHHRVRVDHHAHHLVHLYDRPLLLEPLEPPAPLTPEPTYATGGCATTTAPAPCNTCVTRDIAASIAHFERLLLEGLANM